MQILYVEDDQALANLVRKRLEQFHETVLEVVCTDTLETTIKFLAVARPDVILLDLGLPDSHGIETYHAVQAAAPEVPVVICSGNESSSTVLKAVQSGAHGFIPKGRLKPMALAAVLETAIKRHHLRMQMVMRSTPPAPPKVPAPGKLEETKPDLQLLISGSGEDEDTDPGSAA